MRLPGTRRTVSKPQNVTCHSAKTSTSASEQPASPTAPVTSTFSLPANASTVPTSQTSALLGDVCPTTGVPVPLVPPKHVQIPEMGVDSNVLFEGLVFLYAVLCLSLQYINVYKTVWWLPHSHTGYALNFYLIDPHLALLLVVLMSRRVVWCFISEIYYVRSQSALIFWLVQLIKLCLFIVLSSVFIYATYHVIVKHSLLYSLFLCYPLLMYVFLFGFDLQPLMGRVLATTPSGGARGAGRAGRDPRPRVALLQHTCSTCPESVRDEAEQLRADFNSRIKQVLFHSMLCAYYTAYVPLCFTQKSIYYDTWWVGQHVCLVWLSAFVMFTVHLLPAAFLDTLHRCSLHLGRWLRVEGRHAHVPYTAWSELQVWQQGALVKHVRGLFKAEGINNSAEPGNGMHARFYFMFHQPLRVTNWLLVISWALIIYQLLLLVQATEWSHIISLAFLLVCNYYELFKLMRDRLVLSRTYRDEQAAETH